jgi:hypothetical protein
MTNTISALVYSLLAIAFAEDYDPKDIVVSPDGIDHYSRRAYEAGRRDAARDLRDGKLAFETYGGPPPPCDGGWKKMLAESYHIQVRQVAECTVDHLILGHARGYNEVAGAEIDRQFGANFIRKSRDEFCDQWERNHK